MTASVPTCVFLLGSPLTARAGPYMSSSRKKLHVCAVKRGLERILDFHEPLYFRSSCPLSFPQGEGVWERIFINLTMPEKQKPYEQDAVVDDCTPEQCLPYYHYTHEPIPYGQCTAYAMAFRCLSSPGTIPVPSPSSRISPGGLPAPYWQLTYSRYSVSLYLRA
jgi:hypothetical protein